MFVRLFEISYVLQQKLRASHNSRGMQTRGFQQIISSFGHVCANTVDNVTVATMLVDWVDKFTVAKQAARVF